MNWAWFYSSFRQFDPGLVCKLSLVERAPQGTFRPADSSQREYFMYCMYLDVFNDANTVYVFSYYHGIWGKVRVLYSCLFINLWSLLGSGDAFVVASLVGARYKCIEPSWKEQPDIFRKCRICIFFQLNENIHRVAFFPAGHSSLIFKKIKRVTEPRIGSGFPLWANLCLNGSFTIPTRAIVPMYFFSQKYTKRFFFVALSLSLSHTHTHTYTHTHAELSSQLA